MHNITKQAIEKLFVDIVTEMKYKATVKKKKNIISPKHKEKPKILSFQSNLFS